MISFPPPTLPLILIVAVYLAWLPLSTTYSSYPNFIKILINEGDGLIIVNSSTISAINKDTPQRDYIGEAGTLSITSNLSSAFNTCYVARSKTSLFLGVGSEEEFLGVVRNITKQAVQLRNVHHFRQSSCETFIFNRTCGRTLPRYEVGDFFPAQNASTFPFDWLSDLYLVHYCEDNGFIRFWDIYSAKGHLLTRPIYKRKIVKGGLGKENKEMMTLLVNLTEFGAQNRTKIMRRQDLGGVDVVASVFLDKTNENDNAYELEVGQDGNGEDVLVSGLSVSIFKDFQATMNFKEKMLKIHFGTDNYFESAFLSDDHQFDINLYHSSVSKNRSEVANPLHPTYFDGVHATFIQPFDQGLRNIYQKPFSEGMWRTLFFTWTCIFLSCKLVTYFRSKWISRTDQEEQLPYIHLHIQPELEETTEEDGELEDLPTFETGLWCIATLCQQGWHRLPASTSMRIIFVTSLILSVVCYAAFTGKIVSELWSIPKPIKSLKHLLSYADKVYLVEASDASYDVLEGLEKRSPDALKKIKFLPIDKIYSSLVKNPGKACVITWPDSISAYVKDLHGQDTDIDAYLCETFSSFRYQSSSSLFVPKNSELEHLFNYRIIIGLERGFIRRYWDKFQRQSLPSCLENNAKITTLEFSHVFFAFFLLLSGGLISVVILIFEVVISKFLNNFHL